MFEQDKDIQEYLKKENPTKDEKVKAYVKRDTLLGKKFNDVFTKSTDKLCISPKSMDSLIDQQFKVFVNNELKKYLKHKETDTLHFNYAKFYASKISSKSFQDSMKLYNFLYSFKEKNDFTGFYNSLSNEDLDDLGF